MSMGVGHSPMLFKRAQCQEAGPAALRKVILPVEVSFRNIGFYGKVTILKDSALMAVLGTAL